MNFENFELAARNKFRFEAGVTSQVFTLEDLYDLPLTSTRSNQASLETVGKFIYSQLQEAKNDGFSISTTKSSRVCVLEQKLELVRHVISVKQEENKAKVQAKQEKDRKELIKRLIAEKEMDDLKNMSLDELKKLAKE